MRFRRSQDTLNEILAREAGLETGAPDVAGPPAASAPDHDHGHDGSLRREDVGELTASLQQLVRDAKPLRFTDRVRVTREAVYDILDRMRYSFVFFARELHVYRENDPAAPRGDTGLDLLSRVDGIDELVHRATPVPLTDDVWVDRARLAARVDGLADSVAALERELDAYRAAGPDAHDRPAPAR